MAKKVYSIPDSLNKSWLETQISFSSASKPIPIYVFGLYIFSLIGWGALVTKSYLGSSGFLIIAAFTIIWIIATVTLLKLDKTGFPQAMFVVSAFTYLSKATRKVITRRNSKAGPFAGIVGIKEYNPKTGLIEFYDHTYGYLYRVIGSGSVLLFDDDREQILDRVDNFYRKLRSDCELTFFTSKEPQKIYRQALAMKRRYDAMDIRDPDLDAIADMNFSYLKNEVGENFRSIHQYLLLRGDNKEALQIAKNVLQSEVENSMLMFKQCVQLTDDDVMDTLAIIFRGKESV